MRAFMTALALALATPAVAQAPTWSSEQLAVWSVVDQSWKDEIAKNGNWPSRYVDDNVIAWGPEFPMPRYKSSMERWARYYDKAGEIVEYELQPMAITISGDTAVVHYGAVTMWRRMTAQGENPPAPTHEMYGITETFVRDDGKWKLLASSGFPLGDDN